MNSLNLRQIDGGNVIKQADFGSNLSFELLDERRRKMPELDGQTATIRLIKGYNIAYQTESLIVDSAVSFKFDRVLEKGIYVLEIVANDYIFPSNNTVKITIEKTAGNYKPENMIKTDLVELQGKIIAIEQREHDVNQELLDVGQKQSEMTKRIEILEQKEDHDTIYDDTEIKKELSELNESIAKKKLYYAYTDKEDGVKGFTKVDFYDSFYREIFNYFGISEKDSDNADDYFWMPTRAVSDNELSRTLSEVDKLKELHEVRRAPTGYTLDRTTEPWTVWFDNGCGMTIPDYSARNEDSAGDNTVYGFGYSANIMTTTVISYPIPQNFIAASMGHISLLKFSKQNTDSFMYMTQGIEIINPIKTDSSKYDWSKCYGENAGANDWKTERKTTFPRVCYELGIWSDSDVKYLGAKLK